jgi:hypothetical protein
VSIKVELGEVQAVAAQQMGFAYLLTVSDDATPHLVAITPAFGDGEITCDAGKTSCRNIGVRPNVSLLWPPLAREDYSLIVDGNATVDETGRRLFDLMLRTASGEKTKSELHGYGQSEFVPWYLGAVM